MADHRILSDASTEVDVSFWLRGLRCRLLLKCGDSMSKLQLAHKFHVVKDERLA
jgi:hypothetical protein